MNITVNPVNDAPVAVDDVLTVNEDTPGSGDLSPNDSDPEGDPLTYTSGTFTTAQGGTITINADGTYTYTPGADYNGPDSYTYTVCDNNGECDTATLTITVNPVNDAPVAGDDNATVLEDTPVSGDLSTNDSDPEGDPLTYTSGTFTTAQGGTITINPDGTYTYTPPAGYTGTDCFTYEVCDNNGACANATICIEVTPNQPPVAEDDTATTVVNTPASGTVADNDSDPEGDPLTYTSGTFTTTQGGTITINPDGTYTYTPPAGYTGTDCFTYEVCDDNGNCSNATLCVEVGDNTTVVVPPAITPNGDGINDTFFIEGIQGKRATLRIFNRWGNVVYENEAYQNDWDGRSNKGIRIGENLPDGTYFYTIEVPELGVRKAGYITLKR
ncbi:Ig-like domain-containing protein [Thermonema rossianum]|uniref:Ig-like domain-containing protein n=1 Tax=Thermonema rossianum TaxID=55505 RepID=UPI000B2A5666|nr:Ig-like domain-containing protein [Thermonema rossianum]